MFDDFRNPSNTAAAREEAQLWDAMTAQEKRMRSGPRYEAWRLANDALMAAAMAVEPEPHQYAEPRAHLVMVAA